MKTHEEFGIFIIGSSFPGSVLPDVWATGWATGPDRDLICVSRTKDSLEAEKLLSPYSESKLWSLVGFLIKWGYYKLFEKDHWKPIHLPASDDLVTYHY